MGFSGNRLWVVVKNPNEWTGDDEEEDDAGRIDILYIYIHSM